MNKIYVRDNLETVGMAYAFIGVLSFSLTLPMTRIAVASLDVTVVGLGRALVAAALAAILLYITHQKLPSRNQLGSLAIIAIGVVLGFPFLSAWATSKLPSSHGAIVLGLLPLATALMGAIRAGERPSMGFWIASTVGSVTVIVFALSMGAGQLQIADFALFGAVLLAAIGYAEGGRLARVMGGWQVISWALVLAAPVITVPVVIALLQHEHSLIAPLRAWLGFGYVSVVSQFLGFFAWYRGLALAGIARASQLQLLQPFLTIMAASLLLGEAITPLMIVAAIIVAGTVALGRKAVVKRVT